jgi:hypothetical protein
MEYNFESIANDLIEKFDKKLESNRKAVNKNLTVIFDFLGNKLNYEAKKEMQQHVDDMLNDGNSAQNAVFTQTMNKILNIVKATVA